jgi:hypothetical protein
LVRTADSAIDGYQSDIYRWVDGRCQERTAAMVHNTVQDPAGHWGGYMRRYTYQAASGTRTCVGNNNAHPGVGSVTNHYSNTSTVSHYQQGSGHRVVFVGDHHAIHEFTWTYPIDGHDTAITVHWLFASGRDHPLWAITYDTSAAPANAVNADSRSPYSDIQWDGGVGANVDGVGWGDRYKFTSLASPITLTSGWDYTQPNTVPYVLEWAVAADAEMGLVQTEPYTRHDAGGYWFYSAWGTRDADGPMPEDWNWTYQLNQYELPWGSTSKRLAWGMNYGAVGKDAYSVYGDDATADGYPYQSYSVYIVLGTHSQAAVFAQVADVEASVTTTLGATVGSVVTSGPAGVARSDTRTYEPAGYNPVYGTWELNAAANQVDATFTVGSGTLDNPLFVIHGWAAAAPCHLQLDSVSIDCGAFHASVNAATQTLWLTVKGHFSGAHRLVVVPDSSCGG